MGMEVNVLNELPGGGGILTVSTHPNATVDSLIGAACQVRRKTILAWPLLKLSLKSAV